MTYAKLNGELRENDWSNGDADYRKRIAETVAEFGQRRWAGRSDIFEWIDHELRPKVEAVNKLFAERYGWDKQAEFSPDESPDEGRDGHARERAEGEARPGYGADKNKAQSTLRALSANPGAALKIEAGLLFSNIA
jgi:hypothetical protein